MAKNLILILGLIGTALVASGDYYYLFPLPILIALFIWGKL